MVSHALLSTDARFFLFPAILVAQVLVGAIGNTPTIWVHGVGDISAAVILSRRNPGEPTNLHRESPLTTLKIFFEISGWPLLRRHNLMNRPHSTAH